jgi:hypothetical protein
MEIHYGLAIQETPEPRRLPFEPLETRGRNELGIPDVSHGSLSRWAQVCLDNNSPYRPFLGEVFWEKIRKVTSSDANAFQQNAAAQRAFRWTATFDAFLCSHWAQHGYPAVNTRALVEAEEPPLAFPEKDDCEITLRTCSTSHLPTDAWCRSPQIIRIRMENHWHSVVDGRGHGIRRRGQN